MIKFIDRRDAGRRLANRLLETRVAPLLHRTSAGGAAVLRDDVIVLGIPRGGIMVADEVARALNAPLDVFIARKIGAPMNRELAIGAVASDGTLFLDQSLIRHLDIPMKLVEQERDQEVDEIQRRIALYRRGKPPLNLQGKIVVLVDDGIATGATTLAALRALKHQNPARVILAVPVAPRQVVPELRAECDELVLLATPEPFLAVGLFYENFAQVQDDQVVELLNPADR